MAAMSVTIPFLKMVSTLGATEEPESSKLVEQAEAIHPA